MPCRCEWDDDEQGVDGAGYEGEEVRVGEGVDIVEGEFRGKAEGAGEVVHYDWIVLQDGEEFLFSHGGWIVVLAEENFDQFCWEVLMC